MDYVLPLLQGSQRVLDVGCGVGALVNALVRRGHDAYGVDVPAAVPQWVRAGNDNNRFFCADATELPFAGDCFDVVISLGVIEHIGTATGHCTLREDCWEQRRSYAREILRVTCPGGRIIIACPNKSFPCDIQHGPTDELSPHAPIRTFLFNKTGLNIHKTWGRYHLLSYPEIRQLFPGVQHFTPLPLKGYFGFGRFRRGFLRPFSAIAQVWIDHMPGFLASSWLNPYVMVQMTK
jgi:SAM-dependent methyltransferase